MDALVLSLVLNGRLAAEDFSYVDTPDNSGSSSKVEREADERATRHTVDGRRGVSEDGDKVIQMKWERNKACMLSDDARKTFIHAFEAKMNAAVTHPVTGRRLDYRRCIDEQVQIMASVIRGKQASYTPMVLR
ncbi:MAG: hypothetical protein ACREXM_03560 [Gammaproteobacteria bacterium]